MQCPDTTSCCVIDWACRVDKHQTPQSLCATMGPLPACIAQGSQSSGQGGTHGLRQAPLWHAAVLVVGLVVAMAVALWVAWGPHLDKAIHQGLVHEARLGGYEQHVTCDVPIVRAPLLRGEGRAKVR